MDDRYRILKDDDSAHILSKIYKVAVDSAGSIVFLFDAVKQSISVVDSTADEWGVVTEQTGVPYEVAKSDIVVEEYRDEYIRIHEEIINGADRAQGRVKLRKADGKVGVYDLYFTALLDENGNKTGKAAGIYRDITYFENRYLHQYVLTRALAEGISSAYYVDFDEDTFVIETISDDINPAVSDFVEDYVEKRKVCYSQTILSYCDRFVHEDDYERMVHEFTNSTIIEKLRTRNSYYIQYKIRENPHDAGFFEVHISNAGMVESDRKAFMSFRCIDEQKGKELEQQKALEDAYEAANRANDAKSDFLSNMSHDIRTPLNAIIGMTAIACTHIDDKDRVQDCLSKITISGKHLLGIINEVLDMSKIEAGKLDLNQEDFDLVELVDNLVTMSQTQITKMNHELKVDIHGIEHELVTGDSQRLQQAFMNIMSNAIKYTPEGGKIRLSITEKPTNRSSIGCYEFIFEDNGIGMSKEFLKHFFEPFARDKDERVEKISGTGLGMPITLNIVRMMNGDIEVESEPNVGTKITVTIFLALQDNDRTFDSDALTDLPVLVVDDDQITCESACDMLNEIGMLGEWVMTGEDAVEKVLERHKKNDDYFAVIVDWKMPGMDGVVTTRAIRRAVGDDIPIIIISAYDWSDIELEARKAGANAFISKPLFKSRVVHTFRTLVEKTNDVAEAFTGTLEEIRQSDFSDKRVLLVEDDDLNAEIATEILKMANLTVEFAENGKKAVDRMMEVEDNYYDIVFMDIQMPIMNGYEATRAIRSVNRRYLKSVPIIALSANAFAEDVEAARDVGMNAHIAKPIEFSQLLRVLNKWLNDN